MSQSEIQQVARATVTALLSLSLKSVLVGGAACSAFGNGRVASDIDIVVLTSSFSQEEIKRKLVGSDPNFFLVASKNPYATYKVLWYKLPSSQPSSSRSFYLDVIYRRECKVDILIPGIMNIPDVPPARIVVVEGGAWGGLPLMPFMPLLMLKLQAWQDHKGAAKQYLRDKQHTDVQDIGRLLDIAIERGYKFDPTRMAWIPAHFVQAARQRVAYYVMFYPETADRWRKVGLK